MPHNTLIMSRTALQRTIKSGLLAFRRNGWLSAATVLIMTLMLFVLGNLVFIGALGQTVLESFESKIDISMYFVPDADEQAILDVKKDVEKNPQVARVDYVSKERALEFFQDQHRDNEMITSALAELDGNPLVASLNIAAHDPSQFAAISQFLAGQDYPIVEKINYFENQTVIDRLGSAMRTIRAAGVITAVFFAFIAVLVAFNTLRMAIYTMREEIAIMRLVGATAWFVRGPFLFSGVLYGLAAALMALLAFFPVLWFVSPYVAAYVPEFNPFNYFLSHIVSVSLLLASAGVLMGSFSSAIAIRRYLEA